MFRILIFLSGLFLVTGCGNSSDNGSTWAPSDTSTQGSTSQPTQANINQTRNQLSSNSRLLNIANLTPQQMSALMQILQSELNGLMNMLVQLQAISNGNPSLAQLDALIQIAIAELEGLEQLINQLQGLNVVTLSPAQISMVRNVVAEINNLTAALKQIENLIP